jgi:ACS family hexuronate transporter-like MFS transporter
MFPAKTKTTQFTIRALRWWIGGLLFASTVINYIDRQSLSVLAPFLKQDFHWSNEQFAYLVVAFRIAYAVGQLVTGRVVDRLGTRNALSLSVAWYSLAAILTPLASGLRSLCTFRFLLGAGESANWPSATKAVAEWFPKQERGWAVALFDSGSSVGAAIAPLLVLGLYHAFGSWRPALAVPGLLGIVWLIAWRLIYRSPENHPRLSDEERAFIMTGRDREEVRLEKPRWSALLRVRATWGILLGRMLTDPVWFFIADWFAIYLASKSVELEKGIVGFWIPFLAADIGNFAGGGISSWLIRRGWGVLKARKAVIVVCGIGMTLLIPAAFTSNLPLIIGLFSLSTCSYAAWSTMALTLPSDLYPNEWVGSVSGISGAGAGFGTIVSTLLIGWTADRYSFQPVLVIASVAPLLATAAVLLLVRRSGKEVHV